MGKDFTVTIDEGSERAEVFMKIFGRKTVHVQNIFPSLVEVPNHSEPVHAYMLDFDFVSEEEFARMADYLAEKFGNPREQVVENMRTKGVPILANDCVLTVENPQRWLDFEDEDDEDDYWDDEDWDEEDYWEYYPDEWDDDDFYDEEEEDPDYIEVDWVDLGIEVTEDGYLLQKGLYIYESGREAPSFQVLEIGCSPKPNLLDILW